MKPSLPSPSTGIPALDQVLCGLIPGDNVVWQVASTEDYAAFVSPFVDYALRQRAKLHIDRKMYYFRFARHAPLIADNIGFNVVNLDPQAGFETFLDGIRGTIARAGRGAYFVFDSLSDLTADWYSDQMVGNFFQLTCPYLYDFETIAYFALMRNTHSPYAMTPITETTQILIEVYRHDSHLYVQPLKVQERTSQYMYTLHKWEGDTVVPVTESHTIAEVLTSCPRAALGVSQYHLGVWTRTLVEAEALLDMHKREEAPPEVVRAMFHRLLRMIISRDDRVLSLAREYLTLDDLVNIGKRMLGTGLIGGKSVGMLLARAILRRADPHWKDVLAVHDSFYIPSDVFYTFIVRNGCWELRKRQLKASDYLRGADEARERFLHGVFPPHICQRFAAMLDYYGQSPIIVRSSSLLEDNFGNSFAGKYDSVFCTNQGSPERRLEVFLDAVKAIYASTMSKAALSYRARHGLLDRDEQMALLVQRVAGAQHGRYHYPHIAGVGFSFNPYVWDEEIDPRAGVLRLVYGLGTRAVDRSDDDYTRLVALNAPSKRPESGSGDLTRHAQRRVDVLDLANNRFHTTDFQETVTEDPGMPVHLFASHDRNLARLARDKNLPTSSSLILTFDSLLSKTSFVQEMRSMLETLQKAYDNPVDIEFTTNFTPQGEPRIDLVQCRPLQVKSEAQFAQFDVQIETGDMLLQSHGPVIGHSRLNTINRIVYVVPSIYGQLPVKERYAVARLIGRINQLPGSRDPERVTMLLGPGRWGTTTPSLGVPVSFAEINHVSVLCEIVAMREDLIPDVSFGTHFFAEMVEMNILYLALFPLHEGNYLNTEFFEQSPNRLVQLIPEARSYEHIVRVIEVGHRPDGFPVKLRADTMKQDVVCYVECGGHASTEEAALVNLAQHTKEK